MYGSTVMPCAKNELSRLLLSYIALPLVSKSTRPAMIINPNASVSARIEDPVSAPMPTLSDSCASIVGFPKPENRTIIPSGTAPRNGSTIEPINGA